MPVSAGDSLSLSRSPSPTRERIRDLKEKNSLLEADITRLTAENSLRDAANRERIRDLEEKNSLLEADITRLTAENSLREAELSRLQDANATSRDPGRSTAEGKQPMQPSRPRIKATSSRAGGCGGASSNGEGASSSHHLPSDSTPPRCKVCGNLHKLGDVCPPCNVCRDLHKPGEVCPFTPNVETDIPHMQKILERMKRDGMSLPVSFKNPARSGGALILGPLNSRGRNPDVVHTFFIEGMNKKGFVYVHVHQEYQVDIDGLTARYHCLECGEPWTNHDRVSLTRLKKFWQTHFPLQYEAEWNTAAPKADGGLQNAHEESSEEDEEEDMQDEEEEPEEEKSSEEDEAESDKSDQY